MHKRDYAIDFIRLISIIGVVVIHTAGYFIDRTPPFTTNFYFYHSVSQLSRFAVPLFFCISGYLLGSIYSDIKSPILFYKKRLSKIFIPYMIWSAIYFLFIFPKPSRTIFSDVFLNGLLKGDFSYQLYFIPTIIVFYVAFPFIIKLKNILLTKWFIIFWAIIVALVLSNAYYNLERIDIFSTFRLALYNSFVFIFGIYLAVNVKDLASIIKRNIGILIASTFFLGSLLFTESLLLFKKTGLDGYLRDQWRPGVFAYGISAGALFYHYYQQGWNKIVSFLSSFSFGVFFVHIAVLSFVMRFFTSNKYLDILSFLVALTLTTTLSFAFSIILSKIKLVNKLLGLRG